VKISRFDLDGGTLLIVGDNDFMHMYFTELTLAIRPYCPPTDSMLSCVLRKRASRT
jgi:hypothetical protein